MFERLQKKWKVGGWRLLLILITFAVGGSLTGYAGKMIMARIGISNTAVYLPVYIVIITIIWPMMVLAVSIFTGQFSFFRSYLSKMGRRFSGRTRAPGTAPQQIVIFASGGGSNAQKIIDHFRGSTLATVVKIVCNRPDAGVVSIARKENIPLIVIEKERFFRGDGYKPELGGTDLIVLAGFLWKIPNVLIEAFPRRIVNIHPALLPAFGGKGMYGHHVHGAVLGSGDSQSGITIHYVDEHYDNGDIIFQTACPILPGDTPETLSRRVLELEHAHFPKVIEEILKNGGTPLAH